MRALRRFLGLSPRDRRLLVRAVVLLPTVQLGLTLLPYRWVCRITRRDGPRGDRPPDPDLVDRVVWATECAARWVPRTRCLARALCARSLLQRHGIASEVRFGVVREPAGKLKAHAWLECGGRIILGGEDRDRYQVLDRAEPRS